MCIRIYLCCKTSVYSSAMFYIYTVDVIIECKDKYRRFLDYEVQPLFWKS